ncbi:response regulator [Aliirhizobium cellulosilyticum]|uniref:FixJ family two-component response regulator n=1 Tax=Aliirhizobium cellulosilyticum TaxID=393664 RepID=A0A7W6TFJ6_9HYPH|nr:FixJ family two-component response regulator [Rhizobium cellulosilyticum]MBB4412414.1 FixJ family two-component response regulator [Rhizobium cellulosilyticum]MBB4447046.1 FixJ family two-component response regulator [Rhizobium cellulosilyticum]
MREPKTNKRDPNQPVIYVVDDDLSMRESLVDLFRSMHLDAEAFGSPDEFLNQADFTRLGCIVLDVRLPGVSGLDFQAHLEKVGSRLPIIFMTGYGDISMSVRAMKAGAVDFLAKPFRDQDLLDAVLAAIERDTMRRREIERYSDVAARFHTLTIREREVLEAVVQGLMNKQIAFNLGISEITVKLHRGNVMRKMQAKSLADLVRTMEQANEHISLVAQTTKRMA